MFEDIDSDEASFYSYQMTSQELSATTVQTIQYHTYCPFAAMYYSSTSLPRASKVHRYLALSSPHQVLQSLSSSSSITPHPHPTTIQNPHVVLSLFPEVFLYVLSHW